MYRYAILALTAGLALACDVVDDEDDGTGPGPSVDCDMPGSLPDVVDSDLLVSAGCYEQSSGLVVRDGAVLELEPGVLIRFASGAALRVEGGALTARGRAERPIVLTGLEDAPGSWDGLVFRDSASTANVLEHVFVEAAGGSGQPAAAALHLDDDAGGVRLSARQVTLRSSAGYGLYLEGDQDSHELTWTRGRVTDNAVAAYVPAADLGDLDADTDWEGNELDAVVTGGAATGDATWFALGVPYLVDEDIRLSGGVVTVAPGAVLRHGSGVTLTIESDAALSAVGERDRPILFTGQQSTPGFWDGIRFNSSDRVENALEWVDVEYGGGAGEDGANVYLKDDAGGSRLSLRSVRLRESAAWGLYCETNQNTHRFGAFEDTAFIGNARALHVASEDAGELSDSLAFEPEGEAHFVAVDGDVASSQTWPALAVPYRLLERVDVAPEATLTLRPGATLELGADVELFVEGALAATGTMGAPIVFTGVQKTPGYWRAVRFYSTDSPENRLEHVILEHGGGEPNLDTGLVHLDDDASGVRLSLAQVTFRSATNWGLYVERDQRGHVVDCRALTFDLGPDAEGMVGNGREGELPGYCGG